MGWVRTQRQFKTNQFYVWHYDPEQIEPVADWLGLGDDLCLINHADAQLNRVLEPATDQLGAIIWEEAAKPLLNWLDHRRGSYAGVRVLELGAGAGLVGLALGGAGANATISDVEALLPLLNVNAKEGGGNVTAAVLDWESPGDLAPAFDLIVGCDIIYNLSNKPALLATLRHFLAGGTECVLSVNLDPGRADRGAGLEEFLRGLAPDLGYTRETVPGERGPVAIVAIRRA